MKAYTGTFVKKTGERRHMRFVEIKDLPTTFISGKVKGNKPHILTEGSRVVWDIDEQDFRIFNFKTTVDKIEEFEYTLP